MVIRFAGAARFLPMVLAGTISTVHPPAVAAAPAQDKSMTIALQWRQLPPLPDREGFAGPLAGTSGGALIVAGGANFPDRRPWEGGTKRWYDSIYVLEPGVDAWRIVGRLPRPNAYAVSVSSSAGVVCAGGGDAQQHFRDVFSLRWKDGQMVRTVLASLPRPCAFASGALAGSTLYVAGGIERPAATNCLNTFWALDVREPSGRWQELPPCPGGARMLAVAGAAGESFFLFSGVKLKAGPDGKPVREYLRDAWRYAPGVGWKRLADLPRSAAAAPSPAASVADGRLLVISGDDGRNVGFKPETAHPGFPRDVLAYDLKHDAWSRAGESPFSRATVPTAVWGDAMVIPNGEARPGYRSPEVWSLRAELGR
jgi:N-acetylneuraminic acid mutarotase